MPTPLNNQASIRYSYDSGTGSANSNTVTILVQEVGGDGVGVGGAGAAVVTVADAGLVVQGAVTCTTSPWPTTWGAAALTPRWCTRKAPPEGARPEVGTGRTALRYPMRRGGNGYITAPG